MATTITVTEDVTEVTVTETTTQLNITPQVTTVGVSAVDITAANIAQSISLTPTGNISATNVQSAFAEIGANEDFTTTLKTKLDGIEELATADQTDAEIKTAYENNANTNVFTDDDSAKLNNIEALADVTDATNVAGAGAVMDGDFTSNGFMKRTGAGAYTVDSNTYLTDYTVTELDVRAHEDAIEITESQITDLQSYLTTETDPVFSAHAASGVTATKINNWDSAYNWGNHAEAEYLTSETSHDDVVVDGDFTSAGFMKRGASAGTYEIASTIAFTDLDCVKDEDDMSSDSAIHVPTQQSVKAFVEDREIKAEYHRALGSSQNFTTSYSTMWQEFSIPAYPEKRQHQIEIQSHFASGSSAVNNQAVINVEIKTPSANTAFSLGTATLEGSRGTYEDFVSVSGDITDKLSLGGSVGASTNPSGFGIKSVKEFYYDADNDKTFICIGAYPSSLVTNGNPIEIFFDPFDHEASTGAWVIVDTFKVYITQFSSFKWENYTARLGYISEAFDFRIRVQEIDAGDSVAVLSNKLAITTRKV